MSTTALKIFYIPKDGGAEDYLFATPARVFAVSAKLTADGHTVTRVEPMKSGLGQLIGQWVYGGALWLTGLLLAVQSIHIGFQIVGICLAVYGMCRGVGLGAAEAGEE